MKKVQRPENPRTMVTMSNLTPEQIGWIAGIFEGEGCIHYTKARNAPTMTMQMTDRDVLQRFHALVGGTLYGKPCREGTEETKAVWRWNAYGWPSTKRFFGKVGHLLGKRRSAKFRETLSREPKWTPRPESCGSDPNVPSAAGYMRHRKKGEVACSTCLAAMALQEKLRRQRR